MLAVLVLAGIWVYGVPWVQLTLNTVSTDDAFVNGHVTFVAPRVSGQIARVLVDDNNAVHKGDLLAQLDKEPLQDAVAEKKAAVDIAKADLVAATVNVRGIEAQAVSLRWKLQFAIDDVDNRVAQLHSRVAALDKSKATLKLAQVEFAPGRATAAAVDHQPGGVRSAASRPVGCAGGCCPGHVGCPSGPCLLGIAGAARQAEISARCRPISIRLSPPSGRRRRP